MLSKCRHSLASSVRHVNVNFSIHPPSPCPYRRQACDNNAWCEKFETPSLFRCFGPRQPTSVSTMPAARENFSQAGLSVSARAADGVPRSEPLGVGESRAGQGGTRRTGRTVLTGRGRGAAGKKKESRSTPKEEVNFSPFPPALLNHVSE